MVRKTGGCYYRKYHIVLISGFIEGHHVVLSYPTRGSKSNIGYVDICIPHRHKHSFATVTYHNKMSHKDL